MKNNQEKNRQFADFSEILNRIMYIENIFKKVLIADLLGVNPGLLANWEKRNTIPLNEISAYCRKNNVSLHWLLMGEGPRHIVTSEDQIAEPSAPYTTDHIATLQKKAAAYDTLIAALQPILADIAQISPIKNGKNPEKNKK